MNKAFILCRSCSVHIMVIKRFEFKLITIKEDYKEKLKRLNYENKYLFGNIIGKKQKPSRKKTINNSNEILIKEHLQNKHFETGIKIVKVVAKNSVQGDVSLTSHIEECTSKLNISASASNTEKRTEIKLLDTVGDDINSIRSSSDAVKKVELAKDSPCSFPLYNVSKPDYVKTDLSINSYSDVKKADYVSYPSVTKILSATMSEISKLHLERWKQRLILEMGEEGFQEYSKNLLLQGVLMHNVIKNYFMGVPENLLSISPQLEGCWESLRSVLSVLNDIVLLEKYVAHSELKYKGILDCVAHYRGKPVIIDWKKSDKPKISVQNTYDAPIQIAAYIGALNFDSNYPFKVNEGLVVVAYTNGSKADLFPLSRSNCDKYWKEWLIRLDQYNKLEKSV